MTLGEVARPEFRFAHLLVFLGQVCLLFGLPAVYTLIAPKTGLLGLLGFALYFVANAAFTTFFVGYETFIAPVLATAPATQDSVAPDGVIFSSPAFAMLQGIGGPAYMLGMLLLGIAIFRSTVLPRWSGLLLAIAPVLLLLPIPEMPILTGLLIELPRGLAMATAGYVLVAGRADEHAATWLPTRTTTIRASNPAG